MSMYNLVMGMNSPVVLFILPVLGKRPEEYPRFRDAHMAHEDRPDLEDVIFVYTRVGGGNRRDYAEEIAELRAMPGYVEDFDDSFDSTYATFVFKIPDEWLEDVRKLVDEGDLKLMSSRHRDLVRGTYPKLLEKLNEAWASADAEKEAPDEG